MTTSSASIIKKLLLLFLVIAGLYFAKVFLIPLATAAVLAALFLPFCRWMEEKKIAKGLAALTCVVVILLVIAGIGMLIGWQLSELAGDIPLLKQKASETINRIEEFIFTHLGISTAKQHQMVESQEKSVGNILGFIAGSMVSVLTGLILTLAYIFLLLYYRIHIRDFFLKLFSPSQQTEVKQVISNANNVAQQYLVGLSKMICFLWIMYSIGFSIAGVKNPFFFAILCGMLEIVPFIGNITGSILTLLVSAVQGASLAMLAGIAITYGTVQFIQGWVLEPIIVGPQVKINPMATIFALVIGELLWGIPGIILAIPLTAVFKIVCDHIEPLKPYGFLIGEIQTKKKESPLSKRMKRWFKKHRKSGNPGAR